MKDFLQELFGSTKDGLDTMADAIANLFDETKRGNSF